MTERLTAQIAASPLGGATFLAFVAYPKPAERAQRQRFARACAAGIHKANQGGHAPPELQGWKRDSITNTVNRGLNRITRRRIRCVWMALHQMDVSADEHLNDWGFNEAARLLLDAAGTVDPTQGPIIPETESAYHNDDPFNPGNVKRIIWRESLPALPMTLALPLSMAQPAERKCLIDLLREPGWVPDAIAVAQQLAPVIEERFRPRQLLTPIR